MAECIVGYIPNSNGVNSSQFVIYKFSAGSTLALPSEISSPIGWFPLSFVINGYTASGQLESAPLFYAISAVGTYGMFQTGFTAAFSTNHSISSGFNDWRLDYDISIRLTESNFTTIMTNRGYGWNGDPYLWLHTIIFV
jgi:hypothetical protein